MKRLLIGIMALVFTAGVSVDADAQGRGHGNGHGNNGHGRYVRARKAYVQHYDNHRGQSFKYADQREKAYRKYIKETHKHYHDHDAWYHGKRFEHRSEYVYFPAYHTYYDPYRRGYLYRHSNTWVFSPTMPSFFAGVNVGALSVQFMANLPL